MKKTIYEEIAELSASKDPRDNEWWGHDTTLGDLPKRIEELMKGRVVFVDDLLKMDLLSKEQHDALVKGCGFKKVKTRCPICYTEGIIRKNVEEMIK